MRFISTPNFFLPPGLDNGGHFNTEYQAIANISKSTATRELNELKNRETLTPEGSTTGRGTFYRLKKGFIKGSNSLEIALD